MRALHVDGMRTVLLRHTLVGLMLVLSAVAVVASSSVMTPAARPATQAAASR